MYQKRTMRRASPHTRELMRLANEAEQHWKRLKRLADSHYEADKSLLAMDMRLKMIAKERGVEVGQLTSGYFWPEKRENNSDETPNGQVAESRQGASVGA